jgi:hypothetical protein
MDAIRSPPVFPSAEDSGHDLRWIAQEAHDSKSLAIPPARLLRFRD